MCRNYDTNGCARITEPKRKRPPRFDSFQKLLFGLRILNTTRVYSAHVTDPQLFLTIYDAKSKTSLWSETDHRRLARLEKNREKETVNSAQRLVDDLKTRVTPQ
jgi:hypothetical protein